jgi:hypothetical protein
MGFLEHNRLSESPENGLLTVLQDEKNMWSSVTSWAWLGVELMQLFEPHGTAVHYISTSYGAERWSMDGQTIRRDTRTPVRAR